MTESEIIEGNRLIAEFDGFDWSGKTIFCIDYEDEFLSDKERPFTEQDLKYHKSFDWLMPVWHKIREIGYAEANLEIGMYSLREHIKKALCNGTIELAFTEIVAFIKWYNSVKTK